MAFRVFITSSLKEGVSAESFRDLGARASAMVRDKEPGTTVYNWWIGEDGTVISEDGYADGADLGAHMGNMTESGLLDEWMSLIDVRSVQVLGDVSDATREALTPFGAVLQPRTRTVGIKLPSTASRSEIKPRQASAASRHL